MELGIEKGMLKRTEGAVSEIEYAPDGRILAVGSACLITLFRVAAPPGADRGDASSYAQLAVLRGHMSAVVALDWSLDGLYMQSHANDNEIIYWRVGELDAMALPSPTKPGGAAGGAGSGGATGGGGGERPKQFGFPFRLRDLEWADWTSKHGWPVTGLWDKFGKYLSLIHISEPTRPY